MVHLGIVLKKEILKIDTIRFIDELKKQFEITFFIDQEFEFYYSTRVKGVQFRFINSRGLSLRERFAKMLFRYFGFLPGALNNYKVVSYFALENIQNAYKRQWVERVALPLSILLPKFISYEWYLRRVFSVDESNLSGIDKFLFFTQIEDDYILARCLDLQLPVFIYLYSWDHACKLTRLPTSANYLVWNEGVKEDLAVLNKVQEHNIFPVGATQFIGLNDFISSDVVLPETTTRTIYFVFSTLYEALIEQEIAFVTLVDRIISNNFLPIQILARTYPNRRNQKVYNSLESLKNVKLEYVQREALSEAEALTAKYNSINNSEGLFHFGTTLGLEASFLSKPVFIIDFYDFIDQHKINKRMQLKDFVHQYQNDKYLLQNNNPNIIKSRIELEQIIVDLADGNLKPYMRYNKFVSNQFPLLSVNQICDNVIKVINN